MKKIKIPVILIFCIVFNALGADSKRKVSLSIYEVGDSIVDYDTNFKNLFHNWTVNYIENAPDYKLQSYTFIETISDSSIYNYYCRYFTSQRMIITSIKFDSHSTNDGKIEEKYAIEPDFFTSDFLFSSENARVNKMLEDRLFLNEVLGLFSDEFDVENAKLVPLKYFQSSDTLNDTDFKQYILENFRAERTLCVLSFRRNTKIGDKVYAILFRYNGKLFTDYVICDSDSKKVISDSFFLEIKL
jgi:hypothetical protein